ncbi:MAG TPA: hypothetical protein VK995_02025, partial [Oceanipulchritudo sp.]|nr:hypothetical protein [Oceanipulchritudo sp.]
GQHFGDLLAVHGELPVQRFPGLYKNMGPQYVRGIVEGNGNPPGEDLWVTYSVNKEDIWISRIPVPVQGVAPDGPVKDDFQNGTPGELPQGWNIYRPVWAPVDIVDAGDDHGPALQLKDEDPFDYAAATRVFPSTRSALIRFNVLAKQLYGRLEIDVLGADGSRPVQVAFTREGKIEARHEGVWKPAGSYPADQWIAVEIDVNPGNNTERYQLRINGKEVLYRIAYFSEFPKAVERLTFRTGEYRLRGDGGHELPGADEKAPTQTFLIDDLSIVQRP